MVGLSRPSKTHIQAAADPAGSSVTKSRLMQLALPDYLVETVQPLRCLDLEGRLFVSCRFPGMKAAIPLSRFTYLRRFVGIPMVRP